MRPLAGHRLDKRHGTGCFSGGSFMSEHIVAVFATENDANTAARDLEAAGVPASSIRHYRPQGTATNSSVRGMAEPTPASGGGFWAWLLGEDTDETTRSTYPRDEEWYDLRANAGNAVLSVMVQEDSQIHRALTILESHHPIEIDESTDERAVGGSFDRTLAPRLDANLELPGNSGFGSRKFDASSGLFAG